MNRTVKLGLLLSFLAAPVANAQEPAIVKEAQEFMRTYAVDLLAGNREAIAQRYDRTLMYHLGNGLKVATPYDSIVAIYKSPKWQPPVTFEWQNLSYEPVSPDAVVIAGQFHWGVARDKPPLIFSYTSLLHRQDGQLRIRVEDESGPLHVPEKK